MQPTSALTQMYYSSDSLQMGHYKSIFYHQKYEKPKNERKQTKRLFGYLSLLCMILSVVSAKEIRVAPQALSQWSFYGEGFVAVDAQQGYMVLAETPGSKGVMLVSPESYDGDIVVSYQIRPLTPESVLVAVLSVSDRGAVSAAFQFPEDYDGNCGMDSYTGARVTIIGADGLMIS